MSPLPVSLARNPRLDQWVRIDAADTVTLFTGKAELGQGIASALARIGAEELDVSIDRIRVVTADTALSPDELFTAGSRSIADSGTALRLACAQARAHLVALAAARLDATVEELVVEDGGVATADGRRTSYWELMHGRRFEVAVTGEATPKAPSQYTIVGRPGPRRELLALATGTTRFVHDLRPEGVLHGRIVRPPGPAARLRATDLAPARALPGVVAAVRDGDFLGVVAEREEQAVEARELLARHSRWGDSETLPRDGDAPRWLLEQPAQSFPVVDGLPISGAVDAEAPPPDADRTLQASFTRPLLMHGAIGPSAALAVWRGGELTIWSHSQGVTVLRDALADALDVPAAAIRVVHVVGAGCYGHNGADDAALDAALLARAVPDRPVLLQWTRADEHAWEPYGPAMVAKVRASVSREGQLLDWSADVWSTTHLSRPLPDVLSGRLLASRHRSPPRQPLAPRPSMVREGGIHRNATPIYALPSRRVVKHFVEAMPLRTSSLRALGAHLNVFAIESMMDELASAAGVDPLDFRLAHLEDARARAVLVAAAQRGGWRRRDDRDGAGMGLGFARYKNAEAYAAVLVELRVDDATAAVVLERVVIAADAGQIVDPDGLRNQLEGGAIQSASWTLKERVTFDRSRVTSVDWESYPILRFSEIPEVETVLLDRPAEPCLGAGEATQGPTAGAIANAIFDAVGLRLRDLPFTPARLRDAAL
ncbi:MAG: nicotinate dehydrogenase subunit [Solirubrobacteraceae bacterium]